MKAWCGNHDWKWANLAMQALCGNVLMLGSELVQQCKPDTVRLWAQETKGRNRDPWKFNNNIFFKKQGTLDKILDSTEAVEGVGAVMDGTHGNREVILEDEVAPGIGRGLRGWRARSLAAGRASG